MKRDDREKGRSPMQDEPIDPRFEKLVALLYGELPEAEANVLRREIESDAALRSEFEDLSATRGLLAEWELPEKVPHFVFLRDAEEGGGVMASVGGRASRWRAQIRGLLTATPWAVATAAILVAFLAWKDFRIDRTNGAIAFRFGGPVQEAPLLTDRGSASLEKPPVADGSHLPAGALEPGRLVDATPGQEAGAYLTHAEFENYSDGMARTMVALLSEYSRRRDQELTGLLQGAFGRLNDRQVNDYAELRGRLDALQQGVTMQRTVTDSRLDYLMRTGAQGPLAPSDGSSDSAFVKEGAKP